jgi:hypothetical protein
MQRMKWTLTTIALLLLLSACGGASLKEKQAQFERTTLAPLQEAGYRIAQKEEGEEKSRYLLRLDQGEKVASLLLKNALGSTKPEWSRELAKGLSGSGLELSVDWKRYVEARPGSVTATLLPRKGTGSPAPITTLLQARKLRADLDFDEAGSLTQLRLQPLDETVEQNGSLYHLVMEGTGLKLTGPGTYSLESDRIALTGKGQGASMTMESRGLRCEVTLKDAYLGTRQCRLDRVVLATETPVKGGRVKDRIVLEKLEGASRVRAEKGEILSDARLSVGRFTLQGDHPGETVAMEGKALSFQGDASQVPEALYRQIMALVAAPPAQPEAVAQALAPLLEKLFRHFALHYTVELGELNATVRKADETRVVLGLQGYRFGLGGTFARDLNLSKHFELRRLTLEENRAKTKVLSLDLEGLQLGVRGEEVYNFLPELMGLALESTRAASPARKQALKRQAETLGAKVLQRGIHLQVAPLKLGKLSVGDASRQKRFGAMEAQLDVRLKPNRLEPGNPMAMMLALAYLQADGKVLLSRKDLEQILPELDPAMAAMVRQYVKYEGDRAVFTLRFEQGNLLINGKPLR